MIVSRANGRLSRRLGHPACRPTTAYESASPIYLIATRAPEALPRFRPSLRGLAAARLYAFTCLHSAGLRPSRAKRGAVERPRAL